MNSKKKLLFITEESPYPPRGGGQIRDFYLIELLREKINVEILTFQSDPSFVLPEGVTQTTLPRDRPPRWRRSIYLFRTHILNGFSQRMASEIEKRAPSSEIILFSRLATAKYLRLAKKYGLKTILDEHNVESDLLITQNRQGGRLALNEKSKAYQCRYFETRFCAASDLVFSTSKRDADLIQKLAPRASVRILPNMIDFERKQKIRKPSLEKSSPSQAKPALLFTGTLSYTPNVEGIHWFMQEVLPRLKKELPSCPRIIVAGSNPSSPLVSSLQKNNIEIYANPESMDPYLEQATLVLAPIFSGSGTRIKILEAMASGKAVVSTSKGAEGLGLTSGNGIVLADTPVSFTEAIKNLLGDPGALQTISLKAAEIAEQEYDWRNRRPLIELTLKELLSSQDSK